MKCQFCGSSAQLKDSSVIYGRSYGPIWMCPNRKCDAYCGCHPGTNKPLGTLANKELREARKFAHSKFDPIWKQKLMSRSNAYKELAQRLDVDEIHIGESDLETCKKIAQISEELWHELTVYEPDGGSGHPIFW